jgi:hypothetical protein
VNRLAGFLFLGLPGDESTRVLLEFVDHLTKAPP